jgi:uncharacterized membrane protein YdjX (TVP38/TMEM64 family)
MNAFLVRKAWMAQREGGRYRLGAHINDWIDWLLKATHLEGLSILLVTIPLAVIQGFLGIFPFATLIMLHISILGLAEGLFASWLAGSVAAIVVYLICRYFFSEWFNRKWLKRMQRYEKWQKYFNMHGVWAIILLRTLPIMPNNLISFMSAVSSIKTSSYIWSSLLGNLSHIWLFGIISSSIVKPSLDIRLLIGSYAVFCVTLIAIFIAQNFKSLTKREAEAALPVPQEGKTTTP